MAERLPLLLIPGLLANHQMWAHQIESLSDLADCWVAPLPAYDDLGAIAEDILAESPDQFAVAGWSMGGYLCFEILRRAPERVLMLGLFSTAAEPEKPEVSRRRRMMLRDLRRLGLVAGTRSYMPRFIHPDLLQDERVTDSMVKQAFEVGAEAFRNHQRAMMGRGGYLDLLPTISCPTMIVVGRQDQVAEVEGHAKMARSIKGSHLVVIDHCGHMVTLERPDVVAAAMRRWLTRNREALAA